MLPFIIVNPSKLLDSTMFMLQKTGLFSRPNFFSNLKFFNIFVFVFHSSPPIKLIVLLVRPFHS